MELNQDMIDTEVAQQEASRRINNVKKQKQATSNSNKDLERSLEQVIGRIDDDQDEQLENLAALNEQLSDENRELRDHVKQLEKELISAHENETMRAQL